MRAILPIGVPTGPHRPLAILSWSSARLICIESRLLPQGTVPNRRFWRDNASRPDRSGTRPGAPRRAPCECSEMEQHLQAIVTVLSLVNPLICGTMFAQVEAGQSRAMRLADATKAALAVLVILVITALVGARVLQIFGVSLDAFSIAGGGVLSWIGFAMLRATHPRPKTPRRIELPRNGRSGR